MRLVFMGTPAFATPTLQALAAAGREILAVYTQPPRPAGRGKRPRPSAVQAAAEALGLPVRAPESFRDPGVRADFAALRPDVAVVVAYGQLLPQETLDAPRCGCLNLHASLLPRWRGAAPIQRAVMAGDAETGVAVMGMVRALDAGPVLLEARAPIGPEDTAGDLHDRLAALGAPLMVEAVAQLEAGTARPRRQTEDGLVYAAKIDKAEAAIDWSLPAAEVDRRIRGLSPAPGAWFERAGVDGAPARIKALRSRLEAAPAGAPEAPAPGTALDDGLLIACGDTASPGAPAVRLLEVQRAGRGPSPA
ncbi:MAG: methionyl-tRNA formyltransferase, partial [Pseudomonadota bacterium]